MAKYGVRFNAPTYVIYIGSRFTDISTVDYFLERSARRCISRRRPRDLPLYISRGLRTFTQLVSEKKLSQRLFAPIRREEAEESDSRYAWRQTSDRSQRTCESKPYYLHSFLQPGHRLPRWLKPRRRLLLRRIKKSIGPYRRSSAKPRRRPKTPRRLKKREKQRPQRPRNRRPQRTKTMRQRPPRMHSRRPGRPQTLMRR